MIQYSHTFLITFYDLIYIYCLVSINVEADSIAFVPARTSNKNRRGSVSFAGVVIWFILLKTSTASIDAVHVFCHRRLNDYDKSEERKVINCKRKSHSGKLG